MKIAWVKTVNLKVIMRFGSSDTSIINFIQWRID